MPQTINRVISDIGKVLVGKELQIKLALACLIARGHLLIEDLPGMGKTTLAHAIAKALGLSFSRVQFTSDLLPADILGVSVYDKNSGEFNFHPGPIFNQLLLADEINRTTPKTQSALLEAMAEGQASLEGETRPLPKPFFVIATQNPLNQSGTFPLPESQLDRFLMRLSIGYPNEASERQLLMGADPREVLASMAPSLSVDELQALQTRATDIKASGSLISYLQRLTSYSRQHDCCQYGVSPRGALALLAAAKAWALIAGRSYVIPEDVQAVMPSVLAHRLTGAGEYTGVSGEKLVEKIISSVDIL